MLEEAKSFLKFYSIVVIGIISVKMFFKKKTSSIDVAALVPTFILICNF